MGDLLVPPTQRWSRLRYHQEQARLFRPDGPRFRVVPAGRRSGKTEIAKRYLLTQALRNMSGEGRYFFGAPTQQQAERIYWNDLLAFSPPSMILDVSRSKHRVTYLNGTAVYVMGLDAPARVEGSPWDGCVLDEIADMRDETWPRHVRPALSDRQGWAWFIGVPEGRNHFWEYYKRALSTDPNFAEWGAYSWPSADILPAEELRQARHDLDADTFAQEYEASFVTYAGRVYREFAREVHVADLLTDLYSSDQPLIFCLDFNVAPGSAVVVQERRLPSGHLGVAALGEVHIPTDSDTVRVCRELIADWSGHRGPVRIYGDPAGGQRRTSGVVGTDWDLVRQVMQAAEVDAFRGGVEILVEKSHPRPVDMVNATNSLLRNVAGEVRLMVDHGCEQLIQDLEGVKWKEGEDKVIDKKADKRRTHWTDCLGYYAVREWPVLATSGYEVGRMVA